jgi:hypothetical protein
MIYLKLYFSLLRVYSFFTLEKRENYTSEWEIP